jgi:hypothetical protein
MTFHAKQWCPAFQAFGTFRSGFIALPCLTIPKLPPREN